MNRALTLLFWLVAFIARAQQPAYRDFDVQQPAEPKGGLKALNQFIAVNVTISIHFDIWNAIQTAVTNTRSPCFIYEAHQVDLAL